MNQMKTKQSPTINGLVASLALALATTSCLSAAPAEPSFSDVFIAGKDQFKSIRIPSVVVTKQGTVLAIAEGRSQHADQANNKLILKRSTDGGKTWGAQQTIADDGENCLNNPCTVVDQNTGRVIMMYQSFPANHSERAGRRTCANCCKPVRTLSGWPGNGSRAPSSPM